MKMLIATLIGFLLLVTTPPANAQSDDTVVQVLEVITINGIIGKDVNVSWTPSSDNPDEQFGHTVMSVEFDNPDYSIAICCTAWFVPNTIHTLAYATTMTLTCSVWNPNPGTKYSCNFGTVLINGHNAWLKGLAKSSSFPLLVWAGTTGIAAALVPNPALGTIAGSLGLVGLIAQKMGEDPPDCTNGLQKPDFSNVVPVNDSLTGLALLASRIQYNSGVIVALGEAAIIAQNRADCPTRSQEGITRQFTYAQALTHRMGMRLLTLRNQMVRVGDNIERRGVLTEEELVTLDAGAEAAITWGTSLVAGESELK